MWQEKLLKNEWIISLIAPPVSGTSDRWDDRAFAMRKRRLGWKMIDYVYDPLIG
jgi:hypothetical protein